MRDRPPQRLESPARAHDYIGRGLAGEDAARGVAGVGAIVVEANAANQLAHTLLADTGVGATGARSDTVEALVDAAQQRVFELPLVGCGCASITS